MKNTKRTRETIQAEMHRNEGAQDAILDIVTAIQKSVYSKDRQNVSVMILLDYCKCLSAEYGKLIEEKYSALDKK